MNYFRRVYKLEIGAGDNLRTFDGFPSGDPLIAPAQIQFRVDHTPAGERSHAEITLYGLNRESRQASYRQLESIRLTAGYVDGYGIIFDGQISNVSIGREGRESFVKLFCRSGIDKKPVVNRSFGPNTPQLDIIKAVAETVGLPVEIIGDFSKLPRAIKGCSISSTLTQEKLAKLARQWEFSWFIENGKVVLWKNGAARSQTFLFSAATGLIGSPEITGRGVNIQIPLNPSVRAASLFTVAAQTRTPTFSASSTPDASNPRYHQQFPDDKGSGEQQVISVRHEGDFYGGNWRTRVEGLGNWRDAKWPVKTTP